MKLLVVFVAAALISLARAIARSELEDILGRLNRE